MDIVHNNGNSLATVRTLADAANFLNSNEFIGHGYCAVEIGDLVRIVYLDDFNKFICEKDLEKGWHLIS